MHTGQRGLSVAEDTTANEGRELWNFAPDAGCDIPQKLAAFEREREASVREKEWIRSPKFVRG